jgi:glycosyltransferase involved in cell wall biosynthesis
MRILMAHNYYQQPGGEDAIFAAECALLEQKGHTVVRWTRSNDDIRSMNPAALMSSTLWNHDSYRTVKAIIGSERIEVAHFHNTFPLISPAAYYAARRMGVPVVQTLHNYRLICPGSLLYRDGKICEECVGKALPWRAVRHRCYRRSAAQSGAVAGMLSAHRAARTWSSMVTAYVALTEFSRRKFIQGGLPAKRLTVKPNFLAEDPGKGNHEDGYALFVGRLTEDKGIQVLLKAWGHLSPAIPLKIAGDGPLREFVQGQVRHLPSVEFLGRIDQPRVRELMRGAAALIFPSVWYEGLPMTIVEAYATGLPVIASRVGNLASLIEDERTGLLFRPGDPDDMAATVTRFFENTELGKRLGEGARREFERSYSAESNYAALMQIYRSVGSGRKAPAANAWAAA